MLFIACTSGYSRRFSIEPPSLNDSGVRTNCPQTHTYVVRTHTSVTMSPLVLYAVCTLLHGVKSQPDWLRWKGTITSRRWNTSSGTAKCAVLLTVAVNVVSNSNVTDSGCGPRQWRHDPLVQWRQTNQETAEPNHFHFGFGLHLTASEPRGHE